MTYTGKKVRTEDGEDVSEAVATIFDLVAMSMDWGSGMLDNEEMTAVIEFAAKMGWEPPIPASTSEPMVQLCLRYPEHYDVYERDDYNLGRHRTFYTISKKGSKPERINAMWRKVSAEVSSDETRQ